MSVLIVVSYFCWKVFSSNSNMLFFKATSASSVKVPREIYLLSLVSKNLQRDRRPSVYGILG